MSQVTPIRPDVRISQERSEADETTRMFAAMAAAFGGPRRPIEHALTDEQRERLAYGYAAKLPRNNLRCISSTRDERRDFKLRCVEAELARAAHDLESKRIERIGLLNNEGYWWTSPTLRPLVEENNRRWDAYRGLILALAETPVYSVADLRQKRRIIGKVWLTAEGEWYDRVRNGVASDEARLEIQRSAQGKKATDAAKRRSSRAGA
jgi:hypothetical protein